MQNFPSHRSGAAAMVLTLLAAIVIGCGGGGGGGGTNGGTNTNGNASGSGSGSGGGVTDGTSAGTDGGSGFLPQDSVFYVQTDASGSTFDVKYTKADGTGQGTYAAGVSNDNSPMVANPAVAGEFVFAAIPAGSDLYGIYRNTVVSTTGATTVVAPVYSSVSSLQISRGGDVIAYIATLGDPATAPLRLYRSPSAANSAPVDIDGTDYASLSSSGDRIVYSKFPTDADNDTELYVRKTGAATSVRLTTNDLFDLEPQFSKNGALVVFSQQVPNSNRYRLASINLATGAVVTLDPSPALEIQGAPSLNGAGTRVAYVGRSNGAASESGLFVADFPSGANAAQVVPSSDLRVGAYWSTPLGRSGEADTLRLSIRRRR